MTNDKNHDLSIPLASPEVASESPKSVETMTHEEAMLRPRPITFRDFASGCVTTLGGSPNNLHQPLGAQPQSGTEPA